MLQQLQEVVKHYNKMIKEKNLSEDLWEIKN